MELKGIIPAMVTPLHEDESINVEELKNQVNRQIAAGAAALFCLGTNGEFYALSHEEKKLVMKTVAEENHGRLPILAGTGCITTKETIELTLYAKELGYDAVSVIAPYFAESSQDMLVQHYTNVAAACQMPIILYNIPARTGVNMTWQTVAKLAENPYIIGIKDSSGNFDNTLRYIEETPDDFIVLCGNDSLILWTLQAGGNGGISGCANVCPEVMVSIYENFAKGDWVEARRVQDSIRPLRDCFKLANPNSIVKRATNLLGYPVGPAKAPFSLDNPQIDAKLEQAIAPYRK